MSNTFRIGTPNHNFSLLEASDLINKLTASGHSASISELDPTINQQEQLFELLLKDEVDILLFPLSKLSVKMDKSLVIAGLSKRKESRASIFIKKEIQSDHAFGLTKNPNIGIDSLLLKEQFVDILKDAKCTEIVCHDDSFDEFLKDPNLDAVALAEASKKQIENATDHFRHVFLHPTEFVPQVSQGITAYLTKSSHITIRKILAELHDANTARCSNVERKLKEYVDKKMKGPLVAHCTQDVRGNFHMSAILWNNGSLIRAKISQSTSAGMAEHIFNELNKSL